jgi:hypothetical protein
MFRSCSQSPTHRLCVSVSVYHARLRTEMLTHLRARLRVVPAHSQPRLLTLSRFLLQGVLPTCISTLRACALEGRALTALCLWTQQQTCLGPFQAQEAPRWISPDAVVGWLERRMRDPT